MPGDKAALGVLGQRERLLGARSLCDPAQGCGANIRVSNRFVGLHPLFLGASKVLIKPPGVWVGPVTVEVSLCKLNRDSHCKLLCQ